MLPFKRTYSSALPCFSPLGAVSGDHLSLAFVAYVTPMICTSCITRIPGMHLTAPRFTGALEGSEYSAAAHHDDLTGFYMLFCISLLIYMECYVHL